MSSNITGPVNNTCKTRKTYVETPITSSGTIITSESKSDVIVLNPVNDTECNLQCAVGWYHEQNGNAAPFKCAPDKTDRASRAGIATYPIECTSV